MKYLVCDCRHIVHVGGLRALQVTPSCSVVIVFTIIISTSAVSSILSGLMPVFASCVIHQLLVFTDGLSFEYIYEYIHIYMASLGGVRVNINKMRSIITMVAATRTSSKGSKVMIRRYY